MLRTATVTAAAFAVAVALVACGGSGGPNNSNNSGSSASSEPSSATFHADELKVSRCIRANGVPNYPDPSSGGFQYEGSGNTVTVNGVQLDASPQALQNAQQACAQYSPQAPAPSASQLASVRQGAIKEADCMRANGVPNFPDPKVGVAVGGHGIAIGLGAGARPNPNLHLDRSSPAFLAAKTKCNHLLTNRIPADMSL